LVPGFPLLLFLGLASGLCGIAAYLFIQLRRRPAPPAVENYLINPETDRREAYGQSTALGLEVGPELFAFFQSDPRWRHCFGNLYSQLKIHLSAEWGVAFPELRLVFNGSQLEGYRYRIRIFGVPVEEGLVHPEHCALFGRTVEPLPADIALPELAATPRGAPMQLFPLSQRRRLQEIGVDTHGPEELLLREIAKVLKRHVADFIGIQEVHDLLELVERSYPELVREVVPKQISVQKLSEVVRRLVEEAVPIKDFRLILQTIGAAFPEDKDPLYLAEQVRIGLRRTLSYLHSESGRIAAHTVTAEIEEEIRQAIRRDGADSYLVLPPARIKLLSQTFRQRLAAGRKARGVVLTQADIRPYLRRLIEAELPQQPVLSFQELDPKLEIRYLGTVTETAEGITVVA